MTLFKRPLNWHVSANIDVYVHKCTALQSVVEGAAKGVTEGWMPGCSYKVWFGQEL